ncbi:MAG TPA: universal stress protein [Acidiferrobacterales bacterium]|nr:universal stress protein [Acidiferrobacterales bacterium]
MYKHILTPTDGSELSQKAVKGGIGLAKILGAQVTGFYAAPDFLLYAMAYEEVAPLMSQMDLEGETKKQAEEYLSFIEREAQAQRVPVDTLWVKHDSPYVAIIETAQKRGCDLIFMASHGRRGLGALVLGSETMKVLTHTKIPVLVYR